MPSAARFNKMSKKKQIKVQEKLDCLFIQERSWKHLVKSSPFSFSYLRKLLKKELASYENLITSMTENHAFINLSHIILNTIIAELRNFYDKEFTTLSKDAIKKIIDFDSLYLNFVMIATSKLYANVFDERAEDLCLIREVDFKYNSLEWLYSQLVGICFSSLEINDTEGLIELFIYNGKYSVFDKISSEVIKLNHEIMSFLEISGFFLNQKTITETGTKKEFVVYEVRSDFGVIANLTQHIPSITPPLKYNSRGKNNAGGKAVKSIASGSSKITYSQDTIDFLNTAGLKKQRLNMEAIRLIDYEFRAGRGDVLTDDNIHLLSSKIKGMISPDLKEKQAKYYIAKQHEKIVSDYKKRFFLERAWKKLERSIPQSNYKSFVKATMSRSTLNKYLKQAFFMRLPADEINDKVNGINDHLNGIKANSIKVCNKFAGFTEDDLQNIREKRAMVQELKVAQDKRRTFDSMMLFVDIFDGFPLYFNNFLDYRTRCYPSQYLWSRTSGYFKHFLQDFEPTKLDTKGYIAFVYSYLSDPSERDEFLDFLEVDSIFDVPEMVVEHKFTRQTRGQIYNYFRKNIKSPTLSDPIYKKILHNEIRNCSNSDWHTSFQIEIDQSSSVAMFFALFFWNKKLAELTNMTEVESNGIYDFLIQNSSELFNYRENLDDCLFYKIAREHRDFFKYAFMTWGYTQKTQGRFDLWKELIIENLGHVYWANNEKELRDDMFRAAANWDKFIDEIIPGLCGQTKKFTKIMTQITEQTEEILIATTDKSILRWQGFSVNEVKAVHIFNPITKKSKKTFYAFTSDKIDKKRLSRTFLPGFTHMIDAGVVRYIVLYMFRKHKYIVQTIHDAYLISPGHYFDLYRGISLFYKKDAFKCFNFPTDCYFTPNMAETQMPDGKPKQKIEKLIREFNEDKGKFESVDFDFSKLEKMYSPELFKFHKVKPTRLDS